MNELSNSSYKEYLTDALSQTSSKFSVKSYKRANLEEWTAFKSGVDIIVKILWEKTVVYEFVIEKTFWNQRNGNAQDRKYMRRFVDPKIQMFKNCVTRKKSDGV